MTYEKTKEEVKDKDILNEMKEDHEKNQQVMKLILLGPGEAGKSTIFKQVSKIYSGDMSEDDRCAFIPVMHRNILESSVAFASQITGTLGKELELDPPKEVLTACDLMMECKNDTVLTAELAEASKVIWAYDDIKKIIKKRSTFQIPDSYAYFLDKIDKILEDGYIPTQEDIIKARSRTTGTLVHDFEADGIPFQIVDVGGQKNERRKWINHFDNVNGILFVCAISEYDQMMFEDNTTNRMEDALNLFDEVTHYEFYPKTASILFLNKSDLFQEKYPNVPIKDFFPKYEGKSVEDGFVFFTKMFSEKNQKTSSKALYCHVTCATDTNTVAVVFNAVRDSVLQAGLEKAGMFE